ncbi:FtsK/SpoIIIE domain-containing protein [Rudaeicoccus suwonensis]|uniref:S-DNA-T family DNA segregation ATPase FtsK/SpoIIIE n=1 Tax=Rudaeicoccus suwonensis TaxID=657409 RepID=A0A561E1F0_9MICO|nr:FtsK/SpoIIIE domain-containing protein [Rudaeicoccus suwonensis]TWE09411.1 S-DNA-T family DNA segregation ATPase FtsK/SpoIIIE [Rudaeicoccus suwonensis]
MAHPSTGMPPSRRLLRLGVLDPATGRRRVVVLRTPTDCTWSQARAALAEAGIETGAAAYVMDVRVGDDDALGCAPLLAGATISAAPTAIDDEHLLELVAVEGPAVGSRIGLTGRVARVGRASGNALRVDDPDLSRCHLLITVDQGRAMVSDGGSTNGTYVDRGPVNAQPVELRAGQRLCAGSTTFMLEHRTRAAVMEVRADDTGRIPFQRAPRKALTLKDIQLYHPEEPRAPERRPLPWLMVLAPLVLAGVMVAVLRNPMFLMFALLSPVMVLGQFINDRSGGAARARTDRTRYEQAVAEVQERRRAACCAELAIRRRIAPPLTEALRAVRTRDERLWSRSPKDVDYLTWRVGTGTITSRVTVRDNTIGGDCCPETLPQAPITVNLDESRVVGINAAPAVRPAVLAGLVTQLAAWQSPLHLRIVVICASSRDRGRWRWCSDIPHLTSSPAAATTVCDAETQDERCAEQINGLLEDVADAPSIGRDGEPPVHTVVMLDGTEQLSSRHDVGRLLREGRRVGVAVVAIAHEMGQLPAECVATVEFPNSTTVMARGGDDVVGLPDLATTALTTTVARGLACLVDATSDVAAGAVPASATLRAVCRKASWLDPTDGAAITAAWQRRSRSTRALLGVSAQGPLWIDLATDGPHALVAGTTGAGKSELLQTLITSLAVANRPDELVFVLVDYKGGAAFRDCARLPHTVGLVTDLDAHLTARALASLEAEVRRRERLMADVGAKDIDDYQQQNPQGPLPRLALVIDEFRVLAEELPDFISGLVRIAAVGRSLGIHLVLATQRPAGVVSADIRANVNLRIALRVREEADSHDVIGSPRAARIDAAAPGRAILRTGGSAEVEFQTARIGGCSDANDRSIEVGVVDERTGAVAWPDAGPETDSGTTDLHRAVAAIRQAADATSAHAPPSPWLDPLSDTVSVGELAGATMSVTGVIGPATAIAFAIADLPAEQTTRVLAWAPDVDGHLAVVGGSRSGRTAAVRTLAAQAAARWPDGGMAMYVFDGGGSLTSLQQLPQCGAAIGRDEITRLTRLITWLTEEIRSRQQQFDATTATSARILLLIDDWETFTDLSEEVTAGRLTDEVMQILRDGPAVGIHTVATGARAFFTGRIAGHFPAKVLLRLSDSGDASLLGIRATQLPQHMPPGRGITIPDAIEIQVAALTGEDPGITDTEVIRRCAATMSASGVRTFEGIPSTCALDAIAPEPNSIIIGIGGDGPAPLGLPLGSAGELTALIAGPSRSGRTTTLLAIAHRLPAGRRACWIAGAGQLPDSLPPGVEPMAYDDPAAVATWLSRHPDGALLVDDLDDMLGTPAEDIVTEHINRSRINGGITCATGQSANVANVFRGAVAELRRRQIGILLQAGRRDGDLLGVQTGPSDRPRPGRGVLAHRGRATEIQIGTPPDPRARVSRHTALIV